uniref:Phosphatidylinositol specific phospholipase C X domain containing 3 n=1 Tax=Stegastes partitus TaxID=144197 RepID=A0A3B4ZIC7_9TELE
MASSHGRSDLRFADWMASLPQSMHTIPLTNLAIPGSHDSFSFYIDEASPVGPEQPETVQNFVSVFGTVAKKLMRKWLATQTMNFTSQLEAGIRFFDLRISTKPRDPDNELFFAHGLFSATVREGLEQISSFLSAHAREVVFLDFNHFYGVQNLHHEKLVAMLKEVFGDKLCPVVFAQEVTLQYLWEKEYQVLVFYHHPMALEVPFLWPGQMMPSPWANTTDPEKLVQFLQASVTDRRRKGTFFVSQVVLTPKASTVMKGVASGLRETITERYMCAPAHVCLCQRGQKNKSVLYSVQHEAWKRCKVSTHVGTQCYPTCPQTVQNYSNTSGTGGPRSDTICPKRLTTKIHGHM